MQHQTKYENLIELNTRKNINMIRKNILIINLFGYDNSADGLMIHRRFR